MTTDPAGEDTVLIGINLNQPIYWDSIQAFVNLLDRANENPSPQGYWTYRHKDGYTIPGRYAVAADGTGTLELYDAEVPPGSRRPTFGAGQGPYVYEFANQINAMVRVVDSDPNDPIRNIRIHPADLDPARQYFHPKYLERLRGVWALRSVHFYWIEGDKIGDKAGGKDTTWDTANHKRWREFIDLCNVVGARPWLNLPHCADDGYCEELGRLFRDRLAPPRRPVVEYSNELWNAAYPWVVQMNWVMEWGVANSAGGLHQAYAELAGRRWAAFERGYGRDVDRVFANQFANEALVKANIRYARDHGIRFDSIACAPYVINVTAQPGSSAKPPIDWDLVRKAWQGGFPELVAKMVVDPMIESIRTRWEPKMQAWAEIAKAEGVPLYAYESGQHLQFGRPDAELDAIGVHVNRSEDMARLTEELYATMARYFSAANYFCDVERFGGGKYFGLVANADDDTPKCRAFRDLVRRSNV